MANELTFEDAAPDSGVSFEDAAPETKEQPLPPRKAPFTRERLAQSQIGADKSPAFAPFVPLGPDIKATTLPGQVLAAPYNVGKGFLEGVESRGGLAVIPLSVGGPVATAGLGAGFGLPAIKEGLRRVYAGTALKEPQEAIEGGLQALSGGLITAGGARGAIEGLKPKSTSAEINLPKPSTEISADTHSTVTALRKQLESEGYDVYKHGGRIGLTTKKLYKNALKSEDPSSAFVDESKLSPETKNTLDNYAKAWEQFNKEYSEDLSHIKPENVPPSGEAGEAQPSAGPIGATVEAPVAAGETPQAMSETATPEQPKQVGSVTKGVTQPPKQTAKEYLAEVKKINEDLAKGPPPPRETITPSEDTPIGHNADGEPIYQRKDGSVYRMRNDSPKTKPNGYPDFGGDLSPVDNPELTGMGGALAKGEIPETGAGGEKYGVAERVREERAKAGQVEPVPPGQGITTQESIDLGREVIRRDPEAPEKVMSAFENDPKKNISAEGIAVTRAHGEALAAGARNIEEQFGTESPQYEAAKDALSSWDKRTKAMQTEWHKSGMAQQGETDLDTGSFTGLERAYKDATDRDIPVPKKPQAKKIARDNKVAQDSVAEASDKLNKRIVEKATKDPEAAKVWQVAKKYLDENKGLYNFDDLRNKIAADLGMKPGEVARLLAQDRATKTLADDLWNKQRNARRLKEQAKNWLRELDTPGYQKVLASIPRAMFSLSVFGHGFVALGTHAPIVAFQPRFWNAYVRNFGRMYKLVFSPAYYEMQMQDLVRRPNYEVARRAGLQNDPFKYEEFHTTAIRDLVKNWIGEKNMDRVDKATSGGNRGYSVLKVLRQDMFDQAWNRLPDSIRKQEGVAAALSDGINHATGVTAKAAPQGANIALFAPRLAGSRVMWLGGDPIRAANTIGNWKNASTAEKVFAINQVKEKAWVFGTFASLLAANQGFLTASGSDQKINGIPESLGGAGFDPLASDFMKFKAAGGNIAYGGALLTLAKLPARVAVSILYQGKGSKYILEDERVDKVIGSYIRSQMSPFAGTVSDLALGRDYEERPLPKKLFGLADQEGAVPKRLQNEGVDAPFNWPEYTMTKLPIPMAEGIKEGLRASGMNDAQANAWLKALAITSLMTGTGTRITEDTREK